MNQKVKLNVRLRGLAPGTTFDLVGNAFSDELNFEVQNTVSVTANGLTTISLEAKAALPNQVGQVDREITWKLIFDGEEIALASSRNMIYVTYGMPEFVATAKPTNTRTNWATATTSGLVDPHEIVAALHQDSFEQGVFDLGPTPPTVWHLLDGSPGECKDHVKLLAAAVRLIGITEGQVGYVFANTDAAIKGSYSVDSLNGAQHLGNNNNVELRYFDNAGRPNRYEAVFRFTDGGVTKYYSGFAEDALGNAAVFFTPKEVMEGVVGSLGWFDRTIGPNGILIGDTFTW